MSKKESKGNWIYWIGIFIGFAGIMKLIGNRGIGKLVGILLIILGIGIIIAKIRYIK